MRHRKKKKFGRGTDHKRKLLKSLASALILYERIETSLANAKAVKPYAEKLITKSKTNSLHTNRQLLAKLSPNAARKALEVLGPKYAQRKGGYLRLIKLSAPSSGLSTALVELVE